MKIVTFENKIKDLHNCLKYVSESTKREIMEHLKISSENEYHDFINYNIDRILPEVEND